MLSFVDHINDTIYSDETLVIKFNPILNEYRLTAVLPIHYSLTSRGWKDYQQL